jgi:hypothetical protein
MDTGPALVRREILKGETILKGEILCNDTGIRLSFVYWILKRILQHA